MTTNGLSVAAGNASMSSRAVFWQPPSGRHRGTFREQDTVLRQKVSGRQSPGLFDEFQMFGFLSKSSPN
jgi:hypothetical protein